MKPDHYAEIYARKDGKWAWRLRSSANNKILAVDGAQGYSRKIDAQEIVAKVFGPTVPVTEA